MTSLPTDLIDVRYDARAIDTAAVGGLALRKDDVVSGPPSHGLGFVIDARAVVAGFFRGARFFQIHDVIAEQQAEPSPKNSRVPFRPRIR